MAKKKKLTKRAKEIRKKLIVLAVTLLLVGSGYYVLAEKETNVAPYIVLSKDASTPLYIKPKTSSDVLYRLTRGTPLIVKSDVIYLHQPFKKVYFYVDGKEKEGYISPSSIQKYEFDAEVEDEIRNFPDSYKQSLRFLHSMYDHWSFVKRDVNYDLSSAASIYSKKAVIDSDNEKLIASKTLVEGNVWRRANKKTVQYYLDPRNGLKSGTALMFAKENYNVQENKALAKKVLKGSVMEGIDTTTNKEYADLFVNAAKKYNVSLYMLISRATVEQNAYSTKNGKGFVGAIASNDTSGKKYYNIFNIGANTGYQQGIDYAKEQGWDNREKAINGGAKYLADKYITTGQDTLYLQRFDLTSSVIGTHSYMTNIQAPYTEGKHLLAGYEKINAVNYARVLEIPVFKNMSTVTKYPLRGAYNENMTITKTSKITNINTLDISYGKNAVLNDGKATLNIIIKDGDERLVENVDYVITYINNTSKGKASFVITGLNSYSGEKTGYFVVR